MSSAFLDFVLRYADMDWVVFPLQPRNKIPLAADLLPGGFKAATKDKKLLTEWWSRWPNANIGIATGNASGIVVLDVDAGHSGLSTLTSLMIDYGGLPPTPMANTGGGGRHYIFAHPGQVIGNSAGKVGLGLDIRGDGGYIVAPPSVHPSGRQYMWEPSAKPSTTPLAAMPEWLIKLATKNDVAVAQITETQKSTGSKIPKGQRDVTLASLAGTMRKRGMEYDAILAALKVENIAKCDPPLGDADIERIAKSITRYEPTAIPQFKASAIKFHEPRDATAGVIEFIDLINNLEGRSIKTYIRPVDDALGGLERQTLTLLAARPSVGKTTLAWQIARNVASSGSTVYFFSLEMSIASLWAKAACGACGLRWRDFRAGLTTGEQRDWVIGQALDLAEMMKNRLLIDDHVNTTGTIWEALGKYRPDLIVLDHVRLVKSSNDNEVQRLGEVSQALKDAAKEFNSAALVLAQLNRGVESRENKRPQLADLRDSGQLEENADNVIMMYRDDYYDDNPILGDVTKTELLVRKFRDDIRGHLIELPFDTKHQYFGYE